MFFIALFAHALSQLLVQVNSKFPVSVDSLDAAAAASGVSDSDVTKFTIINGVLQSSDFVIGEVRLADKYTKLSSFIVQDGASLENDTVPAFAFYHAVSLKSASFPTATKIGKSAFYNCTSLTDFTAAKVTYIGINAFRFCPGLKELDFPECTKIDSYGIMNCTALEKINIPNVQFIGSSAFHYDKKLTTINISKCTSIGTEAFRETGLVTITLSDSLSYLGAGAFWNSTQLSSSFTLNSLTELKQYTFQNCISLTSVVANNVEVVGSGCFYNCTALKTVVLPKVVSLGYESYFNAGMETIEAPEIETINSFSFYKSALKSFTGNSVSIIGRHSFRECKSLETVSIPNVVEFPYEVFNGCSALKSLTAGVANIIGSFALKDTTSLSSSMDISQFTSIGNYSFYNSLISFTTGTLPNLKVLGNFAFFNNGLTEFVAEKLEWIGERALDKCKNLKKLYIGPTCTFIGYSAFANTTSLSDATLLSNADTSDRPNILSDSPLQKLSLSTRINNLNLNKATSSLELTVSKVNDYCPAGEYVMQSKATIINDEAFASCGELTKITISATVKTINPKAFKSTTKLQQVEFYGTSSLQSIGDEAYADSTTIKSFNIPNSVKTVGKRVFYGCSSLETISASSEIKEKYGDDLLEGNNAKLT